MDATRRLDTPTMTARLPRGLAQGLARGRHRARRRSGRAVVGVATITVVSALVAIVGPALLRLGEPVDATIKVPPSLPAPDTISAATSCDGFWSTGTDLSWSAVTGATGYEVWRRSASAGTWDRITTAAPATTALRDEDLGIDSTYVYRVRALDGPLPGRWSEPATARTPLFCFT
jgi:hypothetical protein